MNKKNLVFIAMLAVSSISFGQQTSQQVNFRDVSEITSLKPADEKPYVFSTKEEMEEAVARKSGAIKDMIMEQQQQVNTTNDRIIASMREDLWRLEHAIVVSTK